MRIPALAEDLVGRRDMGHSIPKRHRIAVINAQKNHGLKGMSPWCVVEGQGIGRLAHQPIAVRVRRCAPFVAFVVCPRSG